MLRGWLYPSLRWRMSRSLGLALATTGCLSWVAATKFTEAIFVTGNSAEVQAPKKLFCLRLVFGRARSRFLGRLMEWRIPVSLRPFLTSVFLHLQPDAARDSRYPLEAYESVGQLFCRTLRDGAREVKDLAPYAMVSPCDCTVSTLGVVSGNRVPQVKGATYSLKAFLGTMPKAHDGNKLMYCVLHLAPHHYHHFHAPCDFSQGVRRHMHGECLPVFRSFLSKFNDIFSVQERVVLSGSWIGGCLHLAAVAACNVGDIRLEREPDLRTNRDRVVLRHLGGDVDIRTFREKPLHFDVGAHVGEFRLGSTIVLVFEAPQGFEFSVVEGDKIRAGSRLGGVGPPVVAKDEPSRKFLHY